MQSQVYEDLRSEFSPQNLLPDAFQSGFEPRPDIAADPLAFSMSVVAAQDDQYSIHIGGRTMANAMNRNLL